MRSFQAASLLLAVASGAFAQPKPAGPRLTNLWLKDSLNSGSNYELVVYFSQPAPAGVAVQLSSSRPDVLVAPASLKVPEGKERASSYFEVKRVSAPVEVTVSAAWGGNTATKTVNILPPAPAKLVNLWINPAVKGGAETELVLFFSDRLAASGATALVSSSNPAVLQVPATITAGEGATRFGHYVKTAKVDAPTEVSVTVSWNGDTVTKTTRVEP